MQKPAPLWRRLAALLYDTLIVAALLFVGAAIVVFFNHGNSVAAGNVLFRFYLLLIIFTYFTTSWCYGGQTLGMRAWRLRLISCHHRPITLPQAFLRFFYAIPSLLCLGIGFLVAFSTPQRITWYDRSSKTQVIVE